MHLPLDAVFCNERAYAIIFGAIPRNHEVDFRSKNLNDLGKYWDVEPWFTIRPQHPNRADHITTLFGNTDLTTVSSLSCGIYVSQPFKRDTVWNDRRRQRRSAFYEFAPIVILS